MSTAPRPTLLLAEDHAEMAAAFRLLIGDHFEVVDVVADGGSLVARALELRPDVILTDLWLQGSDVISAVVEIRRGYPALPIVVMSSDYDPSLRLAALAGGASVFLSKVEAASSIVHILNHLLRAR